MLNVLHDIILFDAFSFHIMVFINCGTSAQTFLLTVGIIVVNFPSRKIGQIYEALFTVKQVANMFL